MRKCVVSHNQSLTRNATTTAISNGTPDDNAIRKILNCFQFSFRTIVDPVNFFIRKTASLRAMITF